MSTSSSNIINVNKNPGSGEYSSIYSAISAVSSPSDTNRWIIYVAPGIYIESQPIMIPGYVCVSGSTNTIVQPTGVYNMFELGPNSMLENITIMGTYADVFATVQNGATDSVCRGVKYVDCVQCAWLNEPTDTMITSYAYMDGCMIEGTGTTGITITSYYGSKMRAVVSSLMQHGTYTTLIAVDGQYAEFNAQDGRCFGNDGVFCRLSNGASATAQQMCISDWGTGFVVSDDSATPNLKVSSCVLQCNSLDIDVQNIRCAGYLDGYSKYSKRQVVDGSPFFVANVDTNVIKVAKNGGDKASVLDALIAVDSPGINNRYVIVVSNGVYVETGTLNIPPYVTIMGSGIETTMIKASGNFDLFNIGASASINYMTIAETPSGYWATKQVDADDSAIRDVVFRDCAQCAWVGSPTAAGVISSVSRCFIVGTVTNGIVVNDTSASGSVDVRCDVDSLIVNASCSGTLAAVIGTKAALHINLSQCYSNSTGTFFNVSAGGKGVCGSSQIGKWATGFSCVDSDAGALLQINDTMFGSTTTHINITNTLCAGYLCAGYTEYTKVIIPKSAPFFIVGNDQRVITVASKGGNFTSVVAALASITDNSPTSRYTIEVGPGIFVETQIVLKEYVTIKGTFRTQTIIVAHPSVAGQPFIVGAGYGALNNFSTAVANYAAAPSCLVEFNGHASGLHFRIDDVIFDTSGDVVHLGSSIGATIFLFMNCVFNIAAPIARGLVVADSAPNYNKIKFIVDNFIWNPDSASLANFVTMFDVKSLKTGTSDPNIFGAITNSSVGSNANPQTGVGLKLFGLAFVSLETALIGSLIDGVLIENAAEPSVLVLSASTFFNNTRDIKIDSATATANINVTADASKIFVESTNTNVGIICNGVDGDISIGGEIYQGSTWGRVTQISDQVQKAASCGTVSGDVAIAVVSGLNVSVGVGGGYLMKGTGNDKYLAKITWAGVGTLATTDNALNWIYVDSSGTVLASTSEPGGISNIVLGAVKTSSGAVVYIQKIGRTIDNLATTIDTTLRDVFGNIVRGGCVAAGGTGTTIAVASNGAVLPQATINVVSTAGFPTSGSVLIGDTIVAYTGITATTLTGCTGGTGVLATGQSVVINNRTISVSSGTYALSSRIYTCSGTNVASFVGYVGGVEVAPSIYVPLQYDNAGVATSVGTGLWAKHALYIIGDGASTQYFLVYAQSVYANELLAQQAGLPIPPSTFVGNMCNICGIIVSGDDAAAPLPSIRFRDTRPTLSFRAEGFSAQSSHRGLADLNTGDDHPQYLRTDGSRAMTGNLNIGAGNITGSGSNTLFGIDLSAHAARHLPGGADALATDVAVSVSTSNALGAASSFARSDHVHKGLYSIKANNGAESFGAVELVDGFGINVTKSGQQFTIAMETPVGAANGGTGLDSSSAANGKLLIGNGAGLSLGNIVSGGAGCSVTNGSGSVTVSNTGVVSVAGTANQISASGSTGSVTLSLPSALVAPGYIKDTSGCYVSTGTYSSAGTTNLDATPLLTSLCIVTSVSANTGVSLPVAATSGLIVTIVNRGANDLKVYPAVACSIDAASVEVPVVLTAGCVGIYEASSVSTWFTIVSPVTRVNTLSVGSTGLTQNSTKGSVVLDGAVNAAHGGTGLTSYTVGDILVADGATSVAKLSDVASGRYLRSGGVGALPVWSDVSLPSSVQVGDLVIASSSNTVGTLPDVAVGSALLSGGVGVAPTYGKVDLVTATSGNLPISRGGTNSGTALNNGRIMVSAGDAIVEAGAMSNGNLLIGSTGGPATIGAITGTSNQINITNGSGSIGLSIPSTFIAPGIIRDTTGMYTSTVSGITATGTTQGTATSVSASYVVVSSVAAGTGIILATPAIAGLVATIVNRGVNDLKVYPATGGAIDSAGANNAVIVAAGTSAEYRAASVTQWYSIGSVVTAGTNASVSYSGGTSTVNVVSSATATSSSIVARDSAANIAANNLFTGFATTVTASGTTTLTASSAYVQQFTGSASQTLKLPDTSSIRTGLAFAVVNNSSGTVTITTSTSVTVGTIDAGNSYITVCVSTASNTAAAWAICGLPTSINASGSTIAVRDSNANVNANNVVVSATSIATAAGTTTLAVSSTYYQIFTGTTTQTVKMPDTSTLRVGAAYLICNTSTGAVTMQTSTSADLGKLQPNTSAVILCTSTSGNTAGSWCVTSRATNSGSVSSSQFWSTSAITVSSATACGFSNSESSNNGDVTASGTSNTTFTINTGGLYQINYGIWSTTTLDESYYMTLNGSAIANSCVGASSGVLLTTARSMNGLTFNKTLSAGDTLRLLATASVANSAPPASTPSAISANITFLKVS